MSFRSPILLAACALIVIFTLPALHPPHMSSTTAGTPELSSEQEGGEEAAESVQWMKWYEIQRTYGNPGIIISDRLQQTWEQISRMSNDPLAKRSAFDENVWTSVGPTNIAGRIRALAIHPAKPNVIYAGAASGGVWKSTNGGLTWSPTSDFMNVLAIGALAIDPNNPDRIFAGTGEPCTNFAQPNALSAPQYYGTGVMRSDDGGATWTKLAWSSTSSAIHRIAIHPTSADTMIVAAIESNGGGGLYKTTDGGTSWVRLLTGVATDVVYSPDNPSRVYAAFGDNNGAALNGVYVSNAGGIRYSWTRLGNNFPAADSCGRIVMAVSPSSPGRLYAAVALAGSKNTTFANDFLLVMTSKDSGATWERRIGAISQSFTNGQAFYDLAMAVKPDNPDFLMLGAVDWYRSTNGGANFSINTDWKLRTSNINSPRYAHADHHAIIFKPGDANTIVIGCDGGVHITTNAGLGWTIKSDNLVSTQFYSCTFSPSSPGVLYGGTQDQSNMRMSAPDSPTWNYLGGGDGGNIALDPVNSSVFYIMINSDPYRTTDGGVNFSKFNTGIPTSEYAGWQPPIFLSPSDRTTLYFGAQHMYRTTSAPTGSANWAAISDYLTRRNNQYTSYISDATCAPTDARVMYVVTGDSKAWRTDNVTVTDPVWTDITSGLPTNRWFSDVFVSWSDPKTVFVTINGFNTPHVYMSTNSGANWTNISGNFPDIPVNALVQSRKNPNTLFLATDLGVWATTDLGTTWQRYGSGLPNSVVWDVTIAPNDTLIAASHGRGMWRATSLITAMDAPPAGPSLFTLSQNYPNPFNPSTTVSFTIGRTAPVRISVYNTQGVRVRTLVDEVRAAGTHAVTFDSGTLPGGVYLCEMEVNGMRQVRKMSLLK